MSPDDDPPPDQPPSAEPPSPEPPSESPPAVPPYDPNAMPPYDPNAVPPYDPNAMPPGAALPAPDGGYVASLADAVGAPSAAALRRKAIDERIRDDDRDFGPQPKGRRTFVIASASILGGLAIAALVFLGRANGERYLITCDSSRVSAEQGRAFPPWGSHALAGPEWKPIALPPSAECKPRETEDVDELGGWYLAILIDRASATLTAKDPFDLAPAAAAAGAQAPAPLDVASAQLEQALLLARSPERRDQRKEIERLLGDVDYWRASARLREASSILVDAARQFETAAAKRPRHATDAAAWAAFLHRLADDLHAGPGGVPAGPTPASPASSAPAAPGTTPAPVGSALPIEPEPEGSAAPPVTPAVPAGGVLL